MEENTIRPEWITAIKLFVNKSKESVNVLRREAYSKDNFDLGPGAHSTHEVWLPWVDSIDEFNTKVIEITYLDSQKKVYIWQSQNYIYSSTKGYEKPGTPINGISMIDGDRQLIIEDDKVTLLYE
jgi:hypothetical protein